MTTPPRYAAHRLAEDASPSQPCEQHRLEVRLATYDRSTLLSLVSILHRRAVDIVSATLDTASGAPVFTVVFEAPQARAATVTASMNNLVDVLDAQLSSPARCAVAAGR